MKRTIVGAILCSLACCHNPAPQQSAAEAEPRQCGMDRDCKGDRICEGGKCIAPTALNPSTAPPALQTRPSAATAIPICEPKDGRTRIPVWTPIVDNDLNLSSAPPQKDGQIVYIELWTDADKAQCNDKDLNSFSRPTNPKEPLDGGLAVNVRGNTQMTNGTCYFKGYYMNEDVMGMHQGWIETYFHSVDKEKLVLADKFCVTRPTN